MNPLFAVRGPFRKPSCPPSVRIEVDAELVSADGSQAGFVVRNLASGVGTVPHASLRGTDLIAARFSFVSTK